MKQETQQQTDSQYDNLTESRITTGAKVICIGNRQTQRIWWLRFS